MTLPRWTVHLAKIRGRLAWSGYRAEGDLLRHKIVLRVDVGSEYQIGNDDGLLYLSRVSLTEGFTPGGLATAARAGMFGFKVIEGARAVKGGAP